jgi:hypothetical protein
MERKLVLDVVPALRERGFQGTFPHFRRCHAKATDLLTFQFDRSGGGFVIEIAEGPPDEFVTQWGKRIPAKRLSAHDLNPAKRARLQPGTDGATDSWFRYDAVPNGGDSLRFDRVA